MKKPNFSAFIAVMIFLGLASPVAFAEKLPREHFGKGNPFTVAELPAGKLKSKLQSLDPVVTAKAMKKLHSLQFEAFDAAEHLRVDHRGGIYVECPDNHGNCDGKKYHASSTDTTNTSSTLTENALESPPPTNPPVVEYAAGDIPISSPAAYNSKPGASRHIYLDFNGASVSGKDWTETDGVTVWNSWVCAAWSNEGTNTTFSVAEQTAMHQIWQRISEDYAAFDVNVTTDVTYDPDNTGYTGDRNKVGWLLFTDTTDTLGAHCPHFGSGGVAYLGVFGNSNYFSASQPAWVATMSVPNMAEAASHEMGHNMGLSHDGTSVGGLTYYGGHAATASAPSWGPIMGTGYGQNVSQWTKGEYYDSNQAQDDLTIISGRLPYRTDDHGNTPGTSTVLLSSNVNQSGIIERTNDTDYFVFSTGAGTLTFNANTYRCAANTWGANLDVLLELYNSSNALVASNNPAAEVNASISYVAAAGTYYLVVKPSGAGTPLNATPSGYTVYGSLGQYRLTGTFIPTDTLFIASPLGGETMLKSTIQEVRWLSGMGGNVKIELFKGGVLNSTISANTPNDGSFYWTVPKTQTVGNDYKIKITSIETPAKLDQSATNFTIADPSNVLLDANMDSDPGFTTTGLFEYGTPVSPNHPTAAKTGTNIYDTDLNATCFTASSLTTKALDCSNHKNVNLEFWASADVYPGYTIQFEVSNDNVNWTQLFSQAGLSSNIWVKYNYNLSAIADGQRTVYVRWSMLGSGTQWTGGGLGIDDVKVIGEFIPADDIYLITPNGGESWTREIPKQIRWTSGMGGNVKIELYKAGVLNTTIAPNVPNDGNYTVILPSTVAAATDYRIKITSIQQPSVSVMSTADFSVVAPSSDILVTNLDSDPGFTTTGLFEYGTPVSPNKVLTGKTGTNIYDTDLNATCFTASTLTTTPIDCSNHTAVSLQFWYHAYTTSTFVFEVSNDNTTWTQLFSQTGSTNNAWQQKIYNISAVADGKPTVYVRWSMTGTASQYTGAGLAIDDISITGTFSPTQYTYTVSYNGNGNTGGNPPINQIKSQNIGLLLSPNSGSLVKTSCTFAGWNTATDGTGTSYNPGDVYTANSSLSLYAMWDAGGYTTWSQGSFTNPFTAKWQQMDPDGDGISNLKEFAFGMDPTLSSPLTIAYTPGGEVTRPGVPIIMNFASAGQSPDYRAVFSRRKDYATAGLSFTVIFSADLQLWTASAAGLSIQTDPGGVGALEAVSIPYPATVPVQAGGAQQAPKFFRVGVTYN